MQSSPVSDALTAPPPLPDRVPAGLRAAWYAVFVLMVCYTLSFVDRLILAFLVTPLKQDLAISDTQIGLLQGLAFAVFYSLLGIPCGLLADRMSRRNLIAWGVLAWSVMTTLSCLARTFGWLLFARMGVGIGEAALAPAAFSLIADLFPRERLSSAMSVYSMGVQVGAGTALLAGGLIVQAVTGRPPVEVPLLGLMPAWRLTFLLVGLPGLLVAGLLLTVREPPRRAPEQAAVRPGLGTAVRAMRERWQSTLGISLMAAFQAMCSYGFGNWAPTFFERVHHWPRSRSGLVLGVLTVICGCLGLFCGGRLSDRWTHRGIADAPLKVGLVSLVGTLVTLVPALLVSSDSVTVLLLVPALFLMALPIGCSYASLQLIFPGQLRGTVSATMLLAINLFGMTLGNLLPGLLDDRVFHSETALGTSIALTVAAASVAGTLVTVLSLAPYRRDLAVQAG